MLENKVTQPGELCSPKQSVLLLALPGEHTTKDHPAPPQPGPLSLVTAGLFLCYPKDKDKAASQLSGSGVPVCVCACTCETRHSSFQMVRPLTSITQDKSSLSREVWHCHLWAHPPGRGGHHEGQSCHGRGWILLPITWATWCPLLSTLVQLAPTGADVF